MKHQFLWLMAEEEVSVISQVPYKKKREKNIWMGHKHEHQ